MKRFSRIIIMTLVLSIFTTMSAMGSFADAITLNNDSTSSIDDYMAEVLPKYFTAQNINVDGEISYSNPISLYDFSNFEIIGSEILIIDGDKFVGKMELYDNNEEYSSLFDTYLPAELTESILNGSNSAFGYLNDNLIYYSDETGYVLIDGFNEIEYPQITPPTGADVCFLDINLPISRYSLMSSNQVGLRVIRVKNKTLGGNGQCDLACAAMVLNYHNGTSLDVDEIYNTLVDAGYGNNPGAKDAFEYYGLFTIGSRDFVIDDELEIVLSANEVFDILSDDNPICMWISTKRFTRGKHGVVIKGITLYSEYSLYTIIDPNKSNQQSFVIAGGPDIINNDISYSGYIYWSGYRY